MYMLCEFLQEHRCEEVKCKRCKQWYKQGEEDQHECFMQQLKSSKLKGQPPTLIFADFECFLDPVKEESGESLSTGTVARHSVALAVALRVSVGCQENWDQEAEDCPHCKAPHKVTFEGENVLENFLKHLLEAPPGTLCIFHNLKG